MAKEDERGGEFFRTTGVAADMLLRIKLACEATLRKPPFLPDHEQLFGDLWRKTGFGSLPRENKEVIAHEVGETWAMMEIRASYQSQVSGREGLVIRRMLGKIKGATEGEVDIDPSRVRAYWGLFAMGLVVNREDFGVLDRYFASVEGDALDSLGTTGFVSGRFRNEMGPIPIVLRGSEEKVTMRHEDIHVWRESRRDGQRVVARLARKFGSGLDDWGKVCLDLDVVCAMAARMVQEESVAYLFEKRLPGETIFSHQMLNLAAVSAMDAAMSYIYFPKCLPEQRLGRCFEVVKQMDSIDLKRRRIVEIMSVAMEWHRKVKDRQFSAWDWAAAMVAVLPDGFSELMLRRALLERMGKCELPGWDVGSTLARAAMIHARVESGIGWNAEIDTDRLGSFVQVMRDLMSRREYESLLPGKEMTATIGWSFREAIKKHLPELLAPGVNVGEAVTTVLFGLE